MSGGQGSPAQSVDQTKMLQMMQQQLGQRRQSGQTPAMQPIQTNGGNWQPQSLQQSWQGMNNPQQFAQQQAMMQQAMRQRQAQAMQNMPQQPLAAARQQPIDNNRRFLTGNSAYWDNYVG